MFFGYCCCVIQIKCLYLFYNRRDEAASRPKGEFVPKTLAELNIEGIGTDVLMGNGGRYFSSNSHKTNHQSNNTKFNNNHKNYDSSNKNNLFNNKTNNSISNNNNQYNLFSSQQNLAKTNIIHSSNSFARSRTYGSQQSLSTASNHSSSSSSQQHHHHHHNYQQQQQQQHHNNNSHRTNNNNDLLLNLNSTTSNSNSYATNSHTNHLNNHNSNNMLLSDINAIPTDVWLNAWNSPPPVTRAPPNPNLFTATNNLSNMPSIAMPTAQSNHITTTTTSNRNHFSNFNSQNGLINDPWTGDFYFSIFFFFSF